VHSRWKLFQRLSMRNWRRRGRIFLAIHPSKADQRVSRQFWTVATFIGLLFGAAAFSGAKRDAFGLFHDDAIYTVVAKSLAQGDGYRIISLPGSPAQTKYPFLYSFLLSGLWALNPNFPQNILVLKLVNIGALVGMVFLAVIFYQRYFPQSMLGALIFAVLVAANPLIFTFTDFVLSDLLFTFFALAGLTICTDQSASAGSFGKIALLGAVVGLACLTRLAAVPLMLAGMTYSFFRGGWRGGGGFLLVVALCLAPWIFWINRSSLPAADSLYAYYSFYTLGKTGVSDFGPWLHEHTIIAFANARYLAGTFELLYLTPLIPALGPVLIALTAVGMFVSLRRAELVNWCFFLSSIALLLFWPFHPGRYAAPLVPLLILFVFRGMKALDRWIDAGAGAGKYALAALVGKLVWFPLLLVLILNGVWLSSYLLIRDEQTTRGMHGSRLPYAWSGFLETFAWIREHTPADALLATAYDPMYYLYTGRRAIRPALHRPGTYFYPYGATNPDVGALDGIQSQLDRLRINYLIIDPFDGYAEGNATSRLLEQLVSGYGDQAKNVFTSTDGKHKIYELSQTER